MLEVSEATAGGMLPLSRNFFHKKSTQEMLEVIKPTSYAMLLSKVNIMSSDITSLSEINVTASDAMERPETNGVVSLVMSIPMSMPEPMSMSIPMHMPDPKP